MTKKPNTKANKPMIFSLVFAACFNEGRAYPFGMGLSPIIILILAILGYIDWI